MHSDHDTSHDLDAITKDKVDVIADPSINLQNNEKQDNSNLSSPESMNLNIQFQSDDISESLSTSFSVETIIPKTELKTKSNNSLSPGTDAAQISLNSNNSRKTGIEYIHHNEITEGSIYPLLSKPFIITSSEKGPGEGEYKLLVSCTKNSFFVLQTTKKSQIIWEYSTECKEIKKFKEFPVHPYIISGTVSCNKEFLIITFNSIHNGFKKNSLFYSFCYSLNGEIEHPVCRPSTICPSIHFGDTPNKFYFLCSSFLETWEIKVTNDDFQLRKILTSNQIINWFGTTSDNKLEYIYFNENKTKAFLEVENYVTFCFDLQKVGLISSYKHLRGHKNQDVILYTSGPNIECIFPRANKKLICNGTEIQHKENGEKISEEDLWRFYTFENDMTFILTSISQDNNILYCILVDRYGLPRTMFTVLLPKNNSEQYILHYSDYSINGFDIYDGTLKTLDFDYEYSIKLLPTTFQPLLHFSTLRDRSSTQIFKFVTNEVLQLHWARPIFDEYYISMLNRDDCSTFCSLSRALSSTLTKCPCSGVQKCPLTKFNNLGQYLLSLIHI